MGRAAILAAGAVVALPLCGRAHALAAAVGLPLTVAAAAAGIVAARPTAPAIFPLALLLLLDAMRAVVSGVPAAAVRETILRLSALSLYVAVAALETARRRYVLDALLLLGALEAGLAMAVPPQPDYPGSRFGSLENPNILGVLGGVVAVAALARMRAAGWTPAGRYALAAAALGVGAIALARCRSGAGGAAAGALLLLAPGAAPTATGLLVAAGAALPLIVVGLDLPFERIEVWRPAVALAGSRPLEGWGVGLGVFWEVATPSTPADLPLWGHAHNLPLQLAVETGFPGLVLALWALVAALRPAGRTGPAGGDAETAAQGAAGRGALVVLTVVAAVDVPIWSEAVPTLAAAAALAAPPPAARPAASRGLVRAGAATFVLATVPSLLLASSLLFGHAWWPAATPLVARAAGARADGRPEEARADLIAAVRRAPAAAVPRLALADVSIDLGDLPAAHASLRAAYARHPRRDVAERLVAVRRAAGAAEEGWPRLVRAPTALGEGN